MNPFLAAALSDRPSCAALEGAGRRWTYAQLAEAAERAGERLDLPAREGRVALLLPPTPEAIVAVHAVVARGALLVPLSTRLTCPELTTALETVEPDRILVPPGEEASVAAAWGGERARRCVRVVGSRSEPSGEVAASHRRADVPGVETDGTPAAAIWTSGTSGNPRGVLLSADAFRQNARASRDRLDLRPGDRWYASLSLAHVGGLALVLRAAILGACVVARGPFRVEDIVELLDAGRITHASLVPTMLHRLLETRGDRPSPPTLRCLLIGGARAPADLLSRASAAGYPVATTYGMTEMTSQVATAPPDLVRRKPHTVGPPLDGVEVRVDGAGEVLARGPTLAAGLLGRGGPLVDADGWYHTGDLGELDGEGHLRVTGRRADRVITGGVNVDPAEVEDILRLHDGVSEAAVVGLPDAEWGERVAAAVVRRPGQYPDPGELEALARARLSAPKIPRAIVFVEALPRNRNGKVDRDEVRRLVEARTDDGTGGGTGGDRGAATG